MLKLLICVLVTILMPICFVKSGEIEMYTREELIEFFIDHGCLIKDESLIMPLLVQNASNISIEEVTNHFLEYQIVDLLFDFKTQSDSKQAVILYELKNDYVALIIFDMSTRYITSTLLLEPACNAYNFSRIILNETTLNEIAFCGARQPQLRFVNGRLAA